MLFRPILAVALLLTAGAAVAGPDLSETHVAVTMPAGKLQGMMYRPIARVACAPRAVSVPAGKLATGAAATAGCGTIQVADASPRR